MNGKPIAAVLIVLSLSGCGATLQQLRGRASLDLDCAKDQIAVREVDLGTRLATGCGKQAIYVENYNNNVHPNWMLNSSIRPVASSTAISSGE